ncbi:MAG: ISAs1 family transposase [Firmicutes bacterium]|nr:ISAs1 family transposase [Bacillota bacterium]
MIDFNALNWAGPSGLRDRLSTLIDPRKRRGIRFPLEEILLLAMAAVLAGMRSYIAISDWIQDLTPEYRERFGCRPWGSTFKVPSEPTIRRTLQSIDREAFDAVLNAWLTEESQRHDNAIAVDGKALRGSGHGRRKRPVQLLAALGHATGQVLGQVDVDIKTNEIPKIKDLLDPLDITDKIVTMDALHTQVETARYLVEDKHAHYIMEVKKNQPNLYEAIAAVPLEDYSRPMVTLNKGHNRIEQRVVRTSTVLNTYLDWPYVGQIFRIDRHVTDLLGEHPRDEVAFGVTDLRPKFASSKRIGKLVRGHWRIETRLHYVRDMAFDEDRSQIRTGSGPQVMATLRNIAIGLIRRMKLPNIQRTLEHLGRRPDQVCALLLS